MVQSIQMIHTTTVDVIIQAIAGDIPVGHTLTYHIMMFFSSVSCQEKVQLYLNVDQAYQWKMY